KSPTAYATNALAFIDAMKAADPDAQVGIGLAPATPVGSPFWNWNETVMAIAGRAVDFVDYHYYTGGGGTDAALLASPARVPATIARLRDLLDRTQGPSHRVDLVVGEANSNAFAGPQQVRPANALFLADFGATLLDHGVAGFEWYSLHDRAVGDGSSWIGDLGMLSSGECVGAICEPPAGTPFPPFHGLRVLNAVMKPHDTIVQASSSDALVSAHAVTRNGKLTVLLVNKSPDTTFLAQLQTPGFDARSYRVIAYYDATGAVEPGHGAPTCAGHALSLAPYSISAVQMSSHSDGCGS
ncbi:MAG TPA: hypothetical protein VGQ38_10270, partial [Gaiellaceae bacterium]|nr:hypothetical protein [Gaiellaceae bacterium]